MPRNRPPFQRRNGRIVGRSETPTQAGRRPPRPRRRRGWFIAGALLLAYSAWEWSERGTVTWPGTLWRTLETRLTDVAADPDAGWRRATEALDKIGAAREGTPAPEPDLEGRVVRVADGDTLSLLDADNRQHKVRLFGIDAPERDQAHGDRAREALEGLVGNAPVGVVVVNTDDYGRAVGTVYRENVNVNLAMVAQGHAWWYRYYAPHEHALRAGEESAREQQLGLWRGSDPVPPWEWRRGRR